MANNPTQLRTRERDKAAGLSTVPADALLFDAGPFALAKAETQEGKTPVRMEARSGQPINHWYWGQVVHDMAGFKPAGASIPIDYCHYPDEVLGYLNEFKASNEGLSVAGELVSFKAGDRTEEVTHKARAGVPYQASIFFSDQDMVLEDVPPKFQTTVNGYRLEGPALVVRQWTLRGVAVCPYGYDPKTSTKLSAAAAGDVHVQFVTQESAMSTKPAAPASTEVPADGKPATELSTKPAEGTKPAVPAVDARAEFQATLTKFSAKFGPVNGAKWAAEGLTYEAALEKHIEAQATELTAEKTKSTELATKLAAIPRGEGEAVSFSDAEKPAAGQGTADPQALKFKIGENLAKVAAGIKLPAKK